ncbi:MAG: hypothetical protein ACRDQB_13165 [Thermocrispum sp.]
MTFAERMSGPFVMGVTDPYEGARQGRRTRWSMTLHARVTIPDIAAFVAERNPVAALSGELELPGVRDRVAFDGGAFRLFPADDDALMRYEVAFDGVGEEDGPLLLAGRKCWQNRPMAHRMWFDTTTLEVRLHRGADATADVAGAGVLRIGASDFARVLTSVRVPQARTAAQAGQAVGAYAWLLARKLGQAYLPGSPQRG